MGTQFTRPHFQIKSHGQSWAAEEGRIILSGDKTPQSFPSPVQSVLNTCISGQCRLNSVGLNVCVTVMIIDEDMHSREGDMKSLMEGIK